MCKLDDSVLLSDWTWCLLPPSLSYFPTLSFSVYLFVSVCVCVCPGNFIKVSRGRKKGGQKWRWFCFDSILPCVFLDLFLFLLFFFLSLYLSLSPAQCWDRGTSWVDSCHGPLHTLLPQGWWLMALKSTNSGKSLQLSMSSYPHTHSLHLSVYILFKTACINTVLDSDICTHTDKLFFTHTPVSYPLQQLAMTGQLTGLFMSRGCLLVVL